MAEATPPPGGSTEYGPERRKNHRVQIAIGVVIKGQGSRPFEESTQTVVVNLNGCLVRMKTMVARNQELSITNASTEESAPVRVSYIGRKDGDKTEIGLGFTKPAPKFWRISFPPEHQDPTERKRFVPTEAQPAKKE